MNESFIRGVRLQPHVDVEYPFNIPAVAQIESLNLNNSVTFLVGENGSGKSTIIEAIAIAAGFNAEGGTKNYNFSTIDTTSKLSDHIDLIRSPYREKSGYFLRAESFYTVANYMELGTAHPLLLDGKLAHDQSHGEAFLSIVNNLQRGLFIFDEPESALSPQRQLSLLLSIHQLVKEGSQFIIATHSPILLAYPNASIYELSAHGVESTNYDDVEHVKLTRDFLQNPKSYISRLIRDY